MMFDKCSQWTKVIDSLFYNIFVYLHLILNTITKCNFGLSVIFKTQLKIFFFFFCVCVWEGERERDEGRETNKLPNLNSSIFLILILLCVGMVELGLCWYMWIDFVLYNIHLWFFWVWFSCVLMFDFLGLYDFFWVCALLCSWWRGW